jgi:phosphate:Na+ symporter
MLEQAITPFQIAIVHSIFNIATTIILFPFTKQLEKLANTLIKDKEKEEPKKHLLDDRLLTTPSFAVSSAFDMTVEMCKLSKDAFGKALGLLDKYDDKGAEEVSELESHIDNYEDQLGTYMVKLSKTGVSEQTSKEIAKILHTIDDFERIGDHAENLVGVAAEMYEKKISFSHEAKAEIGKLIDALKEIVDITSQAFETNDLKLAASVEPLEQVIDKLITEVKSRHIERLQKGNCTIELGFVLTDLLTNFERISDHCSNVAVAIIECQHGTFDTHEYLSHIKEDGNVAFKSMYEEYKQRYSL